MTFTSTVTAGLLGKCWETPQTEESLDGVEWPSCRTFIDLSPETALALSRLSLQP